VKELKKTSGTDKEIMTGQEKVGEKPQGLDDESTT